MTNASFGSGWTSMTSDLLMFTEGSSAGVAELLWVRRLGCWCCPSEEQGSQWKTQLSNWKTLYSHSSPQAGQQMWLRPPRILLGSGISCLFIEMVPGQWGPAVSCVSHWAAMSSGWVPARRGQNMWGWTASSVYRWGCLLTCGFEQCCSLVDLHYLQDCCRSDTFISQWKTHCACEDLERTSKTMNLRPYEVHCVLSMFSSMQ